MPRNPQGQYSLPAGSIVTVGETIQPSQHNPPLQDLASDANNARPVVAGGTGATSASAARSNLGVPASGDVLLKAQNLSDVASAETARTNLGLSTVAATGDYDDLTGKPTIPTLPPELSEAQATDPDDTTFGTVSGQTLAQAAAAFAPDGNWELLETQTITSSVGSVSFTGLGDYRDIMVHLAVVEANDSNVRRALQVSANNGSSFITTSVYGANGAGAQSHLELTGRSSSPRYSTLVIHGFNQTWASKPVTGGHTAAGSNAPGGIGVASALNALRVFGEGSVFEGSPLLTAGQILVFGRK